MSCGTSPAPRWIARAPSARPRSVGAAFALATVAALAACSAPPAAGEREPTGQAAQAIYGGVVDDGGSDAVVAIRVGNDAQQFTLCTGALIAPDVVLTAHHCVAQSVAADVTCDANGSSLSGTQLGADVDPTTLHVFTGAHPDLRYGTAAANGRAVYHPQTSVMCNADVALVVLDTALAITPLPVRLTAPTIAGEGVRAVGYGVNDGAYPVGTRLRRDGLTVLATGAGVSAKGTALGSHEIELGEASCNGDSGGPAISEETGAVIGVVSRSGSCADDFGHVYTQTNGFADLIAQVVGSTGATPLGEQVGPGTPTPDGGGAPSGSSGGAGGSSGASSGGDAGDGEPAGPTRATPTYGGYAPAKSGCLAQIAGGGAGRGAGLEAVALGAAFVFAASRRRKRR